jgi:flagellar hook-associated protein 3 FlgL
LRITSNMLTNNFILNLQSNLKRMEKYQNELSTGKNFIRPSDDPVAVTRSLQTRNDISKTDQYLKNVRDAITWLDQSETTLMEINDIIKRAYELAVNGADGAKIPEDRQIIAKEILQLQEQLVNAANASFNGRFLFGGHNTASKPFEVTGGVPGDYILAYNGTNLETLTSAANTEHLSYEVGFDVKMDVSFTGIDIMGAGSDNLYKLMNELSKALLDGTDQGTIEQSIGKLQERQNRILALLGEVGGKYNRLTLMEKRYDLDVYNFKAIQSEIEDADYAKSVTEFKMAEIVYQSALSAAAKIMQPTLMDFLR